MKFFIGITLILLVTGDAIADKPSLTEVSSKIQKDFVDCRFPVDEHAKTLAGEGATTFEHELHLGCNSDYMDCVHKFDNELKHADFVHVDTEFNQLKNLHFMSALQISAPKVFCPSLYKEMNALIKDGTLQCYQDAQPHVRECLMQFTNHLEDTRSDAEQYEHIFSEADCKKISEHIKCAADKTAEHCTGDAIHEVGVRLGNEIKHQMGCDFYNH